jgi:hypothetical protein
MSIPSNGITPEVIRGVMHPYHLSPDLVATTMAALPAPPPGSTTAWRQDRIARVVQEFAGLKPADAAQASIAAQLITTRGLAHTFTARAQASNLEFNQICRLGRIAVELLRSAAVLDRTLARHQQMPTPFFGTVILDELDIPTLETIWSGGTPAPASTDSPAPTPPPATAPDPDPQPDPQPPPPLQAQPDQSPDPAPPLDQPPAPPPHAPRRRQLGDRGTRPRPRLHPRGPAPPHRRRPGSRARNMTPPPADPPPDGPPPPAAAKPRGNPNPNLALAPRCGARTRAGCPCRSPAIRGKLRCRMHGGRSPGPRTPQGHARMREARTIHGNYCADARALNRFRLTMLRINRVHTDAIRYLAHLPPAFAARLYQYPPELSHPPRPIDGSTAAQDRDLRHAVAASLAPWHAAIALARAAHRAARAAARAARPAVAPRATPSPGLPEPHAPGHTAAPPAAQSLGLPEPHAPARPGTAHATARHEPSGHAFSLGLAEPHAPVDPRSPTPPPPMADWLLAALAANPHTPKRATQSLSLPEPHAPVDPRSPSPQDATVDRLLNAFAAKMHPPGRATPSPGLPGPHAPERAAARHAPSGHAPSPGLPEPHAPEPHAPEPAPPAPPNRAARRRAKYLQRRRDHAARPHP